MVKVRLVCAAVRGTNVDQRLAGLVLLGGAARQRGSSRSACNSFVCIRSEARSDVGKLSRCSALVCHATPLPYGRRSSV